MTLCWNQRCPGQCAAWPFHGRPISNLPLPVFFRSVSILRAGEVMEPALTSICKVRNYEAPCLFSFLKVWHKDRLANKVWKWRRSVILEKIVEKCSVMRIAYYRVHHFMWWQSTLLTTPTFHLQQDVRLGKILIQTNLRTGEPELYYLRLPREIDQGWVFLMEATVATGAAAMMAIRVLLDHDVREGTCLLISY